MKLKKGTFMTIQSYKHDQKLHRAWNKTMILEHNDEHIVTAHKKACVLEDDGRRWFTREPAICFFYPNKWYNVIAMIKKDGIHYYCNISSPYVIDIDGLKYIDYDLDVKLYPDGNVQVLDQKEYDYHKNLMDYPTDLKKILENELNKLIEKVEKREPPFDIITVLKYNDYYQSLLTKKKKKR